MVIHLKSLGEYDFALSAIHVIRQTTTYRQLHVKGRKLNGFVCLLRGKCRFTCKKVSFTMEPGAIAYLPYGSHHVFDILADDTEFFRVDFRLTVDGETVLFSETPLSVCRKVPSECANAIQRLATEFEFVQNSVTKTELMCRIFRLLSDEPDSYTKKRLEPAVACLAGQATKSISCKKLAQLCNLSTAQFYDVFKEEYGMTPLVYRNQLILQRASLLLEDGSQTITEIAEALGFESVAYFSRFFKKHKGMSPSRYARMEWLERKC